MVGSIDETNNSARVMHTLLLPYIFGEAPPPEIPLLA